MRKIRNTLISFLVIFSVSWYVAGVYGKKIIKNKIDETGFLHYKKISLGGYPFAFKYRIDDLYIAGEKSAYRDAVIEKSYIKIDLLSKNFVFEPASPIQIQSHNNQVNYSITFGKNSRLSLSTSKPFFIRYFNNEKAQIQKYTDGYEMHINDLAVTDKNLDKTLIALPKLEFENEMRNSAKEITSRIKFSLEEKGGDELNMLSSGDASLNSEIEITSNKENIIKIIRIKDFDLSAPTFRVKALGAINADDPPIYTNSIKAIFSESIDPKRSSLPDDRLEYIIKNIFLQSSENPNSTEMPITITVSKVGENINFGKNNIFGLSFLSFYFYEKYNAEMLKKNSEEEQSPTQEKNKAEEKEPSTSEETKDKESTIQPHEEAESIAESSPTEEFPPEEQKELPEANAQEMSKEEASKSQALSN
ncbi:MAG: hypothetical protein RLN62_03260 [Rickettsiales bacterium]